MLHEGGGNHLKYHKRGWKGKKGRGNKYFKKGWQAGSRVSALEIGGGIETPLQTIIYIIYMYIYISLATGSYIQ